MMAIPAASVGQIAIRVAIRPPALPFYDQQFVPVMAISGLRAIGRMTTASPIITGFPARGCKRPKKNAEDPQIIIAE
jgi:hypothetical protein